MKRLILTSLCLLFARGAFAWGQKGHDVTAYIAECRLTPEAAEKVRKALDGYSPVYIANWLDFASYWPEYAYSKTWHYLNIDEGETLESMSRNPGGDVLTAVTRLTEKLKSGRLTPEEETLSLKMLIHLVGDMHCPMHLGRLSDLGGNKRPVRFFGRDTNLHSVWDTNIPEAAHKWSYSEWQQQIDRLTDEEAAQIAAGEPAAMSHSVKIVPPCAMPSGLSSSGVRSSSTVAPPSLSSVTTCMCISLFKPPASCRSLRISSMVKVRTPLYIL